MSRLLLLSSFVIAAGFGCAGTTGNPDDSVYLTGTEESFVTLANGQKACLNDKVLVCHIPPGNPDNAHTICVGEPAVQPHVKHHGDLIGECAAEPTPPPDDPPPPDEPPPPDDGGDDGGGDGGGGGGDPTTPTAPI